VNHREREVKEINKRKSYATSAFKEKVPPNVEEEELERIQKSQPGVDFVRLTLLTF
jgi:hypothetical protein